MITNSQSVPYIVQSWGISETLIYNREERLLKASDKEGRKTGFDNSLL
jgi:hypothetical protein